MPEIWTGERVEFPPLREDICCDVCVIGGGITGVLLSNMLVRRGLHVVLLEKDRIASGKTSRSTAKATAAHPLAVSTLWEKVSPSCAKKYAAANLAGVEYIRGLLQNGEVSRDAAREKDMIFYAKYGTRRLKKEYLYLTECGYEAEYIEATRSPLPFPVEGAIRIPRQLALDPIRFCLELCRSGGVQVFEKSGASLGGRGTVHLNGHTVHAKEVAVCTNYPINLAGVLAPIKLSRKTSHAVVFSLGEEGRGMPDVMAFGIDDGHGYRYASPWEDGKDWLIVSGETDRTSLPWAGDRLHSAVREFAPRAVEVCHFTNNDTYTHDRLPYAGKVGGGVYIACGYSAWGMTNAAACAIAVTEQICGGGVWWDDIFSPRRNFLAGGGEEFLAHMGEALRSTVKRMSPPPERYVGDTPAGSAEVINYRGKKAGAYRDDDGRVHIVDLKCPHLGCMLAWNDADKTWDCPCHGSRFSYTGECLSNPSEVSIRLNE